MDLYLQAKQPKAAIELGRQALAGEDRADVHELLGEAYEMDGQTDKAAGEMQEAIKLNRYEEAFYFGLGRLYLRHDKPAEAIQVLQEGKGVFAKSAQLELALGVAYYGVRRFADAADCFLRVIQIAPQVEQPYVFLGRMLDQAQNKLPQVLAADAAYVKARPDNYLANFLYAKALSLQGGDAQGVERLLRKSIELNGGYWESHYELGLLLERRREFERAASEFQRSIALAPDQPTPHYHLARVYDRLGKKAEATAEYAAHQRLSGAESANIRRQESAVTYSDLPAK
jgi:tetratricopeptide (TPR) repeat protein